MRDDRTLQFGIPKRLDYSKPRVFKQFGYKNDNCWPYKFDDAEPPSEAYQRTSANFKFGSNSIKFPFLLKDELNSLGKNREKHLSVSMLSDFIDRLGDNWILFVTDGIELPRDDLSCLVTVDFTDTVERIIDSKIKGLNERQTSLKLKEFQDSIATKCKSSSFSNEMETARQWSWSEIMTANFWRRNAESENNFKKSQIKESLESLFDDRFRSGHDDAKLKTLQTMDEGVEGSENCLEPKNRKALAEIMVFCDENYLKGRMKRAFNDDSYYKLQAPDLSPELRTFLGEDAIPTGDDLCER